MADIFFAEREAGLAGPRLDFPGRPWGWIIGPRSAGRQGQAAAGLALEPEEGPNVPEPFELRRRVRYRTGLVVHRRVTPSWTISATLSVFTSQFGPAEIVDVEEAAFRTDPALPGQVSAQDQVWTS